MPKLNIRNQNPLVVLQNTSASEKTTIQRAVQVFRKKVNPINTHESACLMSDFQSILSQQGDNRCCVYQSLQKLKKKFLLKCVANCNCNTATIKTNTTIKVKRHKVQREVSINALGLTIVVTQAVYKYSKNATSLCSLLPPTFCCRFFVYFFFFILPELLS